MARSDTAAAVLDDLHEHTRRCRWGCLPWVGEYCTVGLGLYRAWRALLAIERQRERGQEPLRIRGVVVVLRETPVWVKTGNDQLEDNPGPEYVEARVLRGPNRVGKLIFRRLDTGRIYRSYEGHVSSVGLPPHEQDLAADDFRRLISLEWRRQRSEGNIVRFPGGGED